MPRSKCLRLGLLCLVIYTSKFVIQALEFDLEVLHAHNVTDIFVSKMSSSKADGSDLKIAARDLLKKLSCLNIFLCFSPPIIALTALYHMNQNHKDNVNIYVAETFGIDANEVRKLCHQATHFISEVYGRDDMNSLQLLLIFCFRLRVR